MSFEDGYSRMLNVQCKIAFVTSLAKGGYVFGSVGLSVSEQHYPKGYERIAMEFYGGVQGGTMKND